MRDRRNPDLIVWVLLSIDCVFFLDPSCCCCPLLTAQLWQRVRVNKGMHLSDHPLMEWSLNFRKFINLYQGGFYLKLSM